jgi:hypothetical protein
MKSSLFVKFLCLSIIVLLVGVSYSSAISSNEKTSILKRQNMVEINCQKINNIYQNTLERCIKKLDFYKKLINYFSKNDPVFKTKFEKLYDSKTTLKDIEKNSPICDVLENIYFSFKDIVYYIRDIYVNVKQEDPLRAFLINIFAIPFAQAWVTVWVIGYEINCWDDPF